MKVNNCSLIKPLTCKTDTPVIEVAKILRDNMQRRIIVVDSKNMPVGIISTTDMNNKVVAENKKIEKTKAEDIMASPIYLVCGHDDDLGEIYKKMVKHESFFVPVTKESKIYGVLTYGELIFRVKETIKNDRQ